MSNDFFNAITTKLDSLGKSRNAAGTTPNMKVLLKDLHNAVGDKQKIQILIDRAKINMYDDFASPLACPILTLIQDLTNAGLHELVKCAKAGKYDAIL